MDLLPWLAHALGESITHNWPLALVGIGAFVAALVGMHALPPERRSALISRLRVGFYFPLALVAAAFVFAVLQVDQSRTLGLVCFGTLGALLLAQLIWVIAAVVRSSTDRVWRVALGVGDLALTFVLLMPVVGLATGFGRSWV